ncbi:MAG: hypothetical protein DMG88_01355 [Acidobacteria bacterium]|nr:MAG: hypothetical protein DMG88_01355 [Acidobacteriota bacterium]
MFVAKDIAPRVLFLVQEVSMPTLDDVYRKFGETAEAAQLLETELGTALMVVDALEENLLTAANPGRAAELLDEINSSTLGRVLKRLTAKTQASGELERLLSKALVERNRLSHSFYRRHNFRRNSDEGRALMLDDLQSIHESIISAYKAVMLLSGVDLDSVSGSPTPTRHLPI